MIILSREQLLLMHQQLIERYGGTHGVRDEGLLDSAMNAPFLIPSLKNLEKIFIQTLTLNIIQSIKFSSN